MNSLKPYDRLANEGARPYAGFVLYRDLGPERSLEKVATSLGKSRSLMSRWSADFAWVERVAAFDADQERAEQEARAKVRAAEAEKWERRRLQAAAQKWVSAKKLKRKAAAMLDFPLAEDEVAERDDEGRPVRVARKPARWNMATAAAMLKIAAELQTAALNEALGDDDDDFDPSTATPEECRAYLRREGVLSDKGEIKALPKPGRRQ